MMREPIVVTGMGVVAPGGSDVASFWSSLEGEPRLSPLDRLVAPGLARRFAGQLPAEVLDAITADPDVDPCGLLAAMAARRAWDDADLDAVPASRIGLMIGTSSCGMRARSRYELQPPVRARDRMTLLANARMDGATRYVARELGCSGPRVTVSTSCTSSTIALCHAFHAVRAGRADAVLVGGVDVIVEELVAGFVAIGAMSEGLCSPFGASKGMNLGEGAGFVVVERAAHARSRGRAPLCVVAGCGLSADGYHATSPDPTGDATVRAVRGALHIGQLEPAAIDLFDAHATGTRANDHAEQRAIDEVFGVAGPSIAAEKRIFGHALGASGILELIATVESVRRGRAPSSSLVRRANRSRHITHAVTHNAAFGGSYAAVAVSERGHARPPRLVEDDVVVLGWCALVARPSDGGRIDAARTRDDHVTDLLLAAARGALDHAGLRVRSDGGPGCVERARIGAFVAADQLPDASARRFWERIAQRGFDRASGPAFARMVLNAPAGTLARALELRGPLSVIAGPTGALDALALAHDMLSQRDDVDVIMVACAVEAGRAALEEDPDVALVEGSGCLLLARSKWVEGAGLTAALRLASVSTPLSGSRPADPHREATPLLAVVAACDRSVVGSIAPVGLGCVQLEPLVAPSPMSAETRSPSHVCKPDRLHPAT
jgi:3-oxoacyl-[acyl-carrier-protein] synthase II